MFGVENINKRFDEVLSEAGSNRQIYACWAAPLTLPHRHHTVVFAYRATT